MAQPTATSFTHVSHEGGARQTRRSSASSGSTIHKASTVYRTLSAFYNPGPLDARPIPLKQARAKAAVEAAEAVPRRLFGRSTRLASRSNSIFSRFFSRSNSCTSVSELDAKPTSPPTRYEAHATQQLDEYHQQHWDNCSGVPQSVLESAILDDLADERAASLSAASSDLHSRSTSNSFSSSAWSPANTERTDITDPFSFVELPSEPLGLIQEDAKQAARSSSAPIESTNGPPSSNCSSLHLPIEAPSPTEEPVGIAVSPPEKMPLNLPWQAAPPAPQTQPTSAPLGTVTTCVSEPRRSKRPAIPPRSTSAFALSQRPGTPPRLSPPPRRRKTLRLFPAAPPPTDLPILPYRRLSLYADADPHTGTHQLRMRAGGARRAASTTSLSSSAAHSAASGEDAARSRSCAAPLGGSDSGWRGSAATTASTVGSGHGARGGGSPVKDETSRLREWELATYSLRYEDTEPRGAPFTTRAAAQLRSSKRWS